MTAELPPGWAETTLDQVALINPPGALTVVPDSQEVTFVPMAAVEELTGRISVAISKPFGEVKKGFTRFREGDVLFAKITPCMENGKIAVAQGLREGVGCGSTEFHILRPTAVTIPEYLRCFLVRLAYRREAQRNMQGAVGQQRVPTDFLRESTIPLAPLHEQQRIVSRIEELFSEIEEGERALERVQKLLERYRQSILKAAVTGELTRDWRTQASQSVRPPKEALLRVLEDRRCAWVHAQQAGKVTHTRYPEAGEPKYGVDAEVPPGWAFVSVEAATRAERPIAYGVLQPGPDVDGGVPLVRVCDVADGRVYPTNLKRIGPDVVARFPRTRLQGGEVLLTIVGTIGRTGIVTPELAGSNVARAVAVLAPQPSVRAEWLELCLREERMRQLLTGSAREVARKTLNLEQLRECGILVPPLAEQDEAISIAQSMLGQAEAVATDVARQARASFGLKQATLKSAFSGQLVSQDSTDEPASVLLARLAANAADFPVAQRRPARLTSES
jgi:type I restriction enzyme S subunit